MEEKTFEVICQDCGKTFESTDEEEILCAECWEKRNDSMEGAGED